MRALRVIVRVLLGVGGGYAVSAALSASFALAAYRLAGVERGEATVLASMLGFVFYLFALLWALTSPALARVALVLLGGSLVAYGVVSWLSPAPASTLAAFGSAARWLARLEPWS
jgi:hypothetical protein